MRNELYLTKEFYDLNIITQAIAAYKELATITVKDQNGYYYCVFSNTICDVERVILEFENYLLALMNV